MKHWQETRRIAREALNAPADQQFAVATVIRIEGSAYRRPGAKLLIPVAGDTLGGVSGGCLEADVREIARDVMKDGRPVVRQYNTGADEGPVWGLGLGCEGTVEILVQPITSDLLDVWRQALDQMAGGRSFVLSTTVSGKAAGHGMLVAESGPTGDDPRTQRGRACLADGASRCEDVQGEQIFFDVLVPPPWIVIIGAGDDAVPLQQMASQVGFRTAVVDYRPAYVTRERFPLADRLVCTRFDETGDAFDPDSYAVVMTHSLTHDRGWVERLLAAGLPYVGVLGPRSRVQGMLEELGVAKDGRVFGPVGLDVGADGAEQIAVSVLAEVLAVRATRRPQHLRDREVPIHAG